MNRRLHSTLSPNKTNVICNYCQYTCKSTGGSINRHLRTHIKPPVDIVEASLREALAEPEAGRNVDPDVGGVARTSTRKKKKCQVKNKNKTKSTPRPILPRNNQSQNVVTTLISAPL